MPGKTLDMGFVKPSLLVSKGFYHKKASGQYLLCFGSLQDSLCLLICGLEDRSRMEFL
jgi:hypothetical protein